MPVLISHYRPVPRTGHLIDWLYLSPGLLIAGAIIGHLIEAMVR
jgi:hypothetical protein